MKIRTMTAGTICYHLRRCKQKDQLRSDHAHKLADALRNSQNYRVPNDVRAIMQAIPN